jgi:uncharacterized protein (DUF4415 family)
MKKKPLTNKEGDVRELLAADIHAMKAAAAVLPSDVIEVLRKRKPGQRGQQKSPTKQQITLRLDHDVVERFRSTGRGWQGRINDALKRAKTG